MQKNTIKRKTTEYFKALGKISSLAVGGLLLASIITPDRAMSETEKRALTELPSLSSYSVFSGSFSSDFENYASDQVAGRGFFVKLYSAFSGLMGSDCINDVYSCDDGYLIERMSVNESSGVNLNINMINNFIYNTKLPATVVIAPNAVSILSDKLPAFAITENQDEWSSLINEALTDAKYVYLSDAIKKVSYPYYRTDHHWTTASAYSALPYVTDALISDTPGTLYNIEPVCTDFIGSLAAKSGITPSVADTISIPVPSKDTNYIVTNMSTKEKSTSIYSLDGLNSSDPYTVFLGGNSGRINIVTENSAGGRLLVFKDSYFNCFLPFLLDKYAEIDVIDPRYYYDDLNMLILEKDYDEVLFFYNMNTFANDTSLRQVLEPFNYE